MIPGLFIALLLRWDVRQVMSPSEGGREEERERGERERRERDKRLHSRLALDAAIHLAILGGVIKSILRTL